MSTPAEIRRLLGRLLWPLAVVALASGVLASPVVAADERAHSATIVGGGNVLLADGATALEAGRVEEGLRLTLQGLREPSMTRDIAAGHANACAGYVLLKQWEDALEHCNEAVDLDNTNWRAFNNRAAIYVAKGLYDLAIRDIEAGLTLAPNSRTLQESMRVAQRNKRITEGRGHRSLPS